MPIVQAALHPNCCLHTAGQWFSLSLSVIFFSFSVRLSLSRYRASSVALPSSFRFSLSSNPSPLSLSLQNSGAARSVCVCVCAVHCRIDSSQIVACLTLSPSLSLSESLALFARHLPLLLMLFKLRPGLHGRMVAMIKFQFWLSLSWQFNWFFVVSLSFAPLKADKGEGGGR